MTLRIATECGEGCFGTLGKVRAERYDHELKIARSALENVILSEPEEEDIPSLHLEREVTDARLGTTAEDDVQLRFRMKGAFD